MQCETAPAASPRLNRWRQHSQAPPARAACHVRRQCADPTLSSPPWLMASGATMSGAAGRPPGPPGSGYEFTLPNAPPPLPLLATALPPESRAARLSRSLRRAAPASLGCAVAAGGLAFVGRERRAERRKAHLEAYARRVASHAEATSSHRCGHARGAGSGVCGACAVFARRRRLQPRQRRHIGRSSILEAIVADALPRQVALRFEAHGPQRRRQAPPACSEEGGQAAASAEAAAAASPCAAATAARATTTQARGHPALTQPPCLR